MVVVLAGLAEDEAVLPLVDVLAGFSLLDIFRRAEIGGIALLTIGGENSRLHALLAVQLHCGFGRHIQGGGQIVIDIAALALGAVHNGHALILHPAGHVALLQHDGLLLTGDLVLQRLAGAEKDSAESLIGHIRVGLGDHALIAVQVLKAVYSCVRHLRPLLFP